MLSTPLRKFISAALLATTGVTGFWFGEGFYPLISSWVLLTLIALPLATAALAPHRDSFHVRTTLLTAALLFIGAWFAGQTTAGRAFDECLTRGEEIRLALRHYRLEQGRFPQQLKDLGVELPGQRLLHSTLLTYQPKEGDYRLSFANALVEYAANSRYPFLLPELDPAPELPTALEAPFQKNPHLPRNLPGRAVDRDSPLRSLPGPFKPAVLRCRWPDPVIARGGHTDRFLPVIGRGCRFREYSRDAIRESDRLRSPNANGER